jgi:hypothetical protein
LLPRQSIAALKLMKLDQTTDRLRVVDHHISCMMMILDVVVVAGLMMKYLTVEY